DVQPEAPSTNMRMLVGQPMYLGLTEVLSCAPDRLLEEFDSSQRSPNSAMIIEVGISGSRHNYADDKT
ncbi:MAG TPA: hypothetical protein VL970_02460, partial [Candidatus Acidoferrales bacterium]|nr:hypothetical protein [Candidatus Acidoferrales bacterium]